MAKRIQCDWCKEIIPVDDSVCELHVYKRVMKNGYPKDGEGGYVVDAEICHNCCKKVDDFLENSTPATILTN